MAPLLLTKKRKQTDPPPPLPPANTKPLTMIFAGLCAFVPRGKSGLTVLFPDAEAPGYMRPAHQATLAHLPTVAGAPGYKPITTGLDYVELSLISTATAQAAIVGLDTAGLVDMAETDWGTTANAKVHPGCLAMARSVRGRLLIDATKLGADLKVAKASGECREAQIYFGQALADYPLKVCDELRLYADVPANLTLSLQGTHFDGSSDTEWFKLFDSGTESETLLFMNLPTAKPFSDPEYFDHHFRKYYDLCLNTPTVQPIVHFKDLKGGLPRCAMALFRS